MPDFENSIDLTDPSQIATTLVPLGLLGSGAVNSSNDPSSLTGASNKSNEVNSVRTPPKRFDKANSIGLNDSISPLIVDHVDLTTVATQPAQTTFNSTFNSTNFDLNQSAKTSIPVFEQSTTISTNSEHSSSIPTSLKSSSTSLESSTTSISTTNSSTGSFNPKKKLNCNQTPEGRIKIDCKRYFRCVRSKTRFVLRVNTCKKDEYFDEQAGLCKTATKGENHCDSKTSGKTSASSRKTGTKRRRKNRYKIKNKRNRSLNAPNGVLRLSFDDLDDEDDVDLDRLNHRLGHHRNGYENYENSHVIVIADHEDFDTEGSYETLETLEEANAGSLARSEDEQNEQEDTGIEEKRTDRVWPCMNQKKLDDFQRTSHKEVVVRNLTEVHIGNRIIDINDSKSNQTDGYSNHKEKTNIKRKENELVQNEDRIDEHWTNPADTDRKRRVTKNVTEIIEQSHDAHQNSTNLDDRKEHQNSSDGSGEQSGKNRRTITNTTIIEQHYGGSKNSKRVDKDVGKKHVDGFEHHQNSKIIIKNATSITGHHLESHKENASSSENSSNSDLHKGKKIFKNVTTIITEEETNESKRNDQTNDFKEIDKKTINQPFSDGQTNSGRIVTRNETITITTEEEGKKGGESSRIEPIKKATESSSDQFHSGKKIVKNVTIITEETNESSSSKRNESGGDSQTNVTIDQVEHVNQGKKPASSNDGSRWIIKNVTTIITEEEENAKSKVVEQPSKHFGKITKNVTIIDKDFHNFGNSKLSDSQQSEHQIESSTNRPESSPIVSRNESKAFESAKQPCESRLNHLKPIAKIIETHHVIKTLFGSATNDLKTNGLVNFVRHVRKNVTKLIRPNNLDDATSLILDRNVSDYLVNEVHESEEKFIFEDQAPSEKPDAIDLHSTRPPPFVELTSQRPASCRPVTEDPPKDTAYTASINPFGPVALPSTTKAPNSHETATIDPHDSIGASTAPSTIVDPQGPKNSDRPLISTTPSSKPGEQPLDFATPQGPVYFDETGDCRSEGFHLDANDASCRRFHLCKVHSGTGRFTVEQFVCVPGQVFDPERKVCVYEQMSGSCSQKKPNASNDSSSLASKSEQKEPNVGSLISEDGQTNTTDSSTRPSTGVPILFTESPSQADRQSTAVKPVSTQHQLENEHVYVPTMRSPEDSSEKFAGSSSRRPERHSEHHPEHQPDHYSSSDELSDRVRVRTSSSSITRFNRAQQHRSQFATYHNDRFLPFSMYSSPHFSAINNPLYAGHSIWYDQPRSYPFGGLFPHNGFRMSIAK